MENFAPPGVIVRWMQPIAAHPLLAVEAAFVANAVPSRVREFAAGRALAREALEALGEPPRPIPVGPSREPVWPTGVTGSISHTASVCAVALARSSDWAAIGLDVEDEAGLVDRSLWSEFCSSVELDWVNSQASPLQAAALLFAAKEAAFKAQFPLTRTMLEFHDIEFEVRDAANSVARVTARSADIQAICGRLQFTFRRIHGHTVVLALLRAEP